MRRGQHVGVAGQTEVVVGAEHDHAASVDLGLGAVVDLNRLEEGVKAGGARLVGELEMGDAGEDVGSVDIALAPVHLVHVEPGSRREGSEVRHRRVPGLRHPAPPASPGSRPARMPCCICGV